MAMTSCNSNADAAKSGAEVKEDAKAEEKKPETPEEKAAAADAEVKTIDGLSLKKVKKRYQNPDPEKYYDMSIFYAYYKDNKLMKLEELIGEEGYISTSHYYFKEDKVFYCYTESSYIDNLYFTRKDYIENDAMYRIVGKEKDPHDENIKFESLKEAPYGEKELKNTSEGFKKGMEETMKNFKAAKND
jgi:hypothetical protein